MGYVHVGQTVATGHGPASFTTLDLSTYVGAKSTLVYISFSPDTDSSWMYGLNFKDPRHTNYYSNDDSTGDFGCGVGRGSVASKTYTVAVTTDTNGYVEWEANTIIGSGPTYVVTLDGYEDNWTDVTSGGEVFNGHPATDYDTINVSGITGAVPCLVACKITYTVGTGYPVVHLNEYGLSWGSIGVYYGSSGVCRGQLDNGAGTEQVLIAQSDDQGRLVFGGGGVGDEFSVEVIGYTPANWTDAGRQIVFDDGAGSSDTPPASLGASPIDLSSYVGSTRQTVLLEVYTPGGSGNLYGFRPSDASGDYVRNSDSPWGTSGVISATGNYSTVISHTGPDGQVDWAGSGNCMVYLLGYATSAIGLLSSLTPSHLGLRVTFQEAVLDDAALRTVSNYTIVADATGYPVTVQSVVPEAGGSPTYVDLILSDGTNGENYTLTIPSDTIYNAAGSKYFTQDLTLGYTAVSILPDVQTLTAVSNDYMVLTFTKAMDQDAAFLSASNYSFDNGLSVLAVTARDSSSVFLQTSAQSTTTYSLTVSSSFEDLYGNPMDSVTLSAVGVLADTAEEKSELSYQLSNPDREKLAGWLDIQKPEPDQVLPLHATVDLEPKEPTTVERLNKTRDLAGKVLSKIEELSQRIDDKCARFKVSSDQGVGSPLFQAMVRVFNEKTTTITYDHYKRALQYRQRLAEEDAAKLKLE